jgi:hypothetical protein
MTHRVACLALLLGWAAPAHAQRPEDPVKLALRAAPAPTPALKYVLLPELSDTKPGNAALLYQRAHSFEWWTNLRKQPDYFKIFDWVDLPWKDVPRAKVEFLRRFGALKEVDLGARRESCDWEMTGRLRKEGVWTAVPDVQGFREYAGLLAMRCRLEIADREYDRAVHTLQTGFALGRHVSDAPLLINALVGNATCEIMLGRVEELIQAPGSPNLYWALTDLPRPLIDLRRGLQGEKLMLEAEFPDLKDIETEPLSREAQKRLLKKLNDPQFWALLNGGGSHAGWRREFGFLGTALRTYPAAKRALIAEGRKAEEVEAMPVLQVILIRAVREYRRLRDDTFKWAGLPYPEGRAGLAKVDREFRKVAAEQPTAKLFLAFVPAIQKVVEAHARLDRHIAALRCVEALRLHAAAHGGKLPAKLSDITEVPVPVDPATGKSFLYEVKGDRVTLRDPPRADGRPALVTPLYYELTFKR